jgi:hypothetical protein
MSVLLAAEADRIQDYLFRSARLREIVGGSQLLAHFCKEVPKKLGVTDGDIITSDGGSFYIKFADDNRAKAFGAELAELYYRATGSTVSVAEPVPYDGKDYGAASRRAARALSQAKQSLGGPVATAHFPHIALCASCGTGLAERHQERFPGDTAPNYLCLSCRLKAEEQWQGKEERKRGEKEPAGEFLGDFYSVLKPTGWDEEEWNQYDWPGRHGPGRWQATAAEDIARFDPRDYVAYIVAECKKEAFVKGLSQELTPVLQESLAVPIRALMERWKEEGQDIDLIPVLPLIMGGDDLFALVPAPWALDIARGLCRTFHRRINEKAQPLATEPNESHVAPITMTAAVVICKRSYPYYLAHEIGEERLGAAKRAVKALAQQEGQYLSAVDFEFIVSSQLPRPEHKDKPKRRATLRPYWVTPEKENEGPPDGWGLKIEDLLQWRLSLSQLPSRQISHFRELYDPLDIPPPDSTLESAWESRREDLLTRTCRDYEGQEDLPVVQAVKALVGQRLADWPLMQRTDDERDNWYGHPLPDLLRVWDFARKLDESDVAYERGEW